MEAILIDTKKSRPDKFLSEKESKKHLEEELADVLGMIIVNAYLLDIDLEKAIKEEWLSRIKSS